MQNSHKRSSVNSVLEKTKVSQQFNHRITSLIQFNVLHHNALRGMLKNECYLYHFSKTQPRAFVQKYQCGWLAEVAAEAEQQGIHSMLLWFSGHPAPFPAITKHYPEHEAIRIHSVYLLNKAALVRSEGQNSFSSIAFITVIFTTKL